MGLFGKDNPPLELREQQVLKEPLVLKVLLDLRVILD